VPPERAGRLDAKAHFDRVFTEPEIGAAATFRVVADRSPVTAVLHEAKEYDLVIIGVSEEWGLESHLFGWRPERIARESSASLMIVRRHRDPALAGPINATRDAADAPLEPSPENAG
jgi:nucleotide-binding universal stress UspA family protein